MRKLLICRHHGGRAGIAWISFQPDGSISFGLRDKTYISPRLKARHFVWNAYNRVGIEYVVPSDPSALEPVQNPHFTFHPAVRFHLKSDRDRISKDEAIFEAIADVGLVLQQQSEMPWIRAVSSPLDQLRSGFARQDDIETDDLVFDLPIVMTQASASIEIEFIRKEDVRATQQGSRWTFEWHDISLRIIAGFVPPQIATFSWFHFY
jgi:hypothetical protein